MLLQFQNFIAQENLFQPTDRVLLAVSAGVDSVAMCSMFRDAKLNFGIAHCNFQLRGAASEDDAEFVKKLAEDWQIPFFEMTVDTEKMAAENKLSIQVAARTLRYEWLEKIRRENNFQYIATAHHLNDAVETVLYNFTKGCGIRGLHGILPKAEKIIRPLLFATKKEVLAFAEKNQIAYREDASNASDKYARNHIRHHVIPLLEKINPSLERTAEENIQRFREVEKLYDFAISELKKEICEERDDTIFIHLEKLKSSPAPASILFEILNPFGYNNVQTKQMLEAIDHQPGALFFSKTHQTLLDRDFFLVKKISQPIENEFFINKNDTHLNILNKKISVEILPKPPSIFPKNKNIAFFDLEKLVFPLRIRRWKIGDTFQPFGMNGQHKKASDIFSDLKLSRFEKEQVWILESDKKIVWLVGIRTDERFKIEDSATKVLRLTVNEKRQTE